MTADAPPHTAERVVQAIVDGFTALPTDFAERVRGFVHEYLGEGGRRVPFGGRADDLVKLSAWLDDKQDPPYLFLAAPAGRGKSALLVHWIKSLVERPDTDVVFVPVSIRFGTNLAAGVFSALAARLARLYAEPIPEITGCTTAVWQGMVRDYLSRPPPAGRRLAVVLDGIDEAADWQPAPGLFPPQPASGVRVLISARYLSGDGSAEAWLPRLGLAPEAEGRAMELAPLDLAGVADVLIEMGIPLERLGAKLGILSELHRLSEGDPLLVRLYVDELRDRGEAAMQLRGEDLRAIKPSLAGYFERWWADQMRLWGDEGSRREALVRSALDLLACALGPIRADELARLMRRELEVTSTDLAGVLANLKRFVIGEGDQHGYVFNHPRLGDYFRGGLDDTRRQAIESRYQWWGRKTVNALRTGRLAPERVPVYVLKHYGAHLVRAGAGVEEMCSLVSDGWQKAWYHYEGAYGGFLDDVDRVWQTAERANGVATSSGELAPHLDVELHCALCFASVHALAENVPPELFPFLVRMGRWSPSQALAFIRQMPSAIDRDDALACLVPSLPAALLEEAVHIAQDIAAAPNDIGEFSTGAIGTLFPLLHVVLKRAVARGLREADGPSRQALLEAIAPHLDGDLLEEAFAFALESGWGAGLIALAPRMSAQAQGEAIEKAFTFSDEAERLVTAWHLMRSAPEPVREGHLEPIIALSRGVQDRYLRTWHEIHVLPHLSGARRRQQLEKCLGDCRSIPVEGGRAELLLAVLDQLGPEVSEDIVQESWAVVAGIEDDEIRAEYLVRLAPHLGTRRMPDLLQALRKRETKVWPYGELTRLVLHLPQALLVDVLAYAEKLAQDDDRTDSIGSLLGALTAHSNGVLAEAVLQVAMQIRSSHGRGLALKAMAPHIPAPLLGRALRAAARLDGDLGTRDAMAGLAPVLPEIFLPTAIDVARTIESGEYRAEALCALLPHLPTRLVRGVVDEALDATRSIDDRVFCEHAMAELVGHLPAGSSAGALRRARRVVDTFGSGAYRARGYTALAAHCPNPEKTELLSGAWAATRGFDGYDRFFLPDDLIMFARLCSEPLRMQALREKLDRASCFPREEGRAAQTVGLVPHLPAGLRARAISVVRNIADPIIRAEALGQIKAKSPGRDVARAFAEAIPFALVRARASPRKVHRAEALTRLAVHLPGTQRDQVLGEAVKTARQIKTERERVKVTTLLAEHVTNALAGDVLSLALGLRHDDERAEALVTLAPALPNPLKRKACEAAETLEPDANRIYALAALEHALTGTCTARRLNEVREKTWSYSRARLPLMIMPTLPMEVGGAVAAEVLRTVAAIGPWWMEKALVGATRHVARLPIDIAYRQWRAAFSSFAKLGRRQMLTAVRHLAPIITKLGGEHAIVGSLRAIQAVGQWWP